MVQSLVPVTESPPLKSNHEDKDSMNLMWTGRMIMLVFFYKHEVLMAKVIFMLKVGKFRYKATAKLNNHHHHLPSLKSLSPLYTPPPLSLSLHITPTTILSIQPTTISSPPTTVSPPHPLTKPQLKTLSELPDELGLDSQISLRFLQIPSNSSRDLDLNSIHPKLGLDSQISRLDVLKVFHAQGTANHTCCMLAVLCRTINRDVRQGFPVLDITSSGHLEMN
ncbi:uncharacterized protein LOC118488834 [Helianthus annuus]|uniref:uncharacterized protein LOC118488834 n=1 Tax=Helianthus annuus TaxID=4232 RepID=UPI00165337D9|nr:uncharacterized protein LOC118488834 [Helianthus annuus]